MLAVTKNGPIRVTLVRRC